MVSMKIDEKGVLNITIKIGLDSKEDIHNIETGEELIHLRGYPQIFPEVIGKLINVFGEYDPKNKKGYIPGGPGKGFRISIEEGE